MSSLKFGTSGLRGLVADLLGRPSFRWSLAFLNAVAAEEKPSGVLIGRDLRASSPDIAAQAALAARAAGLAPIDCGALPTPALALEAARRRLPAIMVTGSHIPEDRNGLKFYRPEGEISKADEAAILASHAALAALDEEPNAPAGPEIEAADALARYRARYAEAFGSQALSGLKVGVYQHSSVARDLLVDLLQDLGAEAVPLGRAERFVPVDTEAHRPEDKAFLAAAARSGAFDAFVSTDGDADRPLIADERGEILRGDVAGLVTAAFLKLDTVVTPVTSGSAIETSGLVARTFRTRVGSPFVIAGMAEAAAAGAKGIAGFEANGGFLLGTDAAVEGRRLAALPTRDAVLPILCVLAARLQSGMTLSRLIASLGVGATAAHRLAEVAPSRSQAFLERLGADEAFRAEFFHALGRVAGVDRLDGVRVTLEDGRIVHYRASGNAPELRCYAEGPSEAEAERLVGWGLERAGAALGAS